MLGAHLCENMQTVRIYTLIQIASVTLLFTQAVEAQRHAVQPYNRMQQCGGRTIDATRYICCDGLQYVRSGRQPACCGAVGYDSFYFFCCGRTIQRKHSFKRPLCCGTRGYDGTVQRCVDGYIEPKTNLGSTCCMVNDRWTCCEKGENCCSRTAVGNRQGSLPNLPSAEQQQGNPVDVPGFRRACCLIQSMLERSKCCASTMESSGSLPSCCNDELVQPICCNRRDGSRRCCPSALGYCCGMSDNEFRREVAGLRDSDLPRSSRDRYGRPYTEPPRRIPSRNVRPTQPPRRPQPIPQPRPQPRPQPKPACCNVAGRKPQCCYSAVVSQQCCSSSRVYTQPQSRSSCCTQTRRTCCTQEVNRKPPCCYAMSYGNRPQCCGSSQWYSSQSYSACCMSSRQSSQEQDRPSCCSAPNLSECCRDCLVFEGRIADCCSQLENRDDDRDTPSSSPRYASDRDLQPHQPGDGGRDHEFDSRESLGQRGEDNIEHANQEYWEAQTDRPKYEDAYYSTSKSDENILYPSGSEDDRYDVHVTPYEGTRDDKQGEGDDGYVYHGQYQPDLGQNSNEVAGSEHDYDVAVDSESGEYEDHVTRHTLREKEPPRYLPGHEYAQLSTGDKGEYEHGHGEDVYGNLGRPVDSEEDQDYVNIHHGMLPSDLFIEYGNPMMENVWEDDAVSLVLVDNEMDTVVPSQQTTRTPEGIQQEPDRPSEHPDDQSIYPTDPSERNGDSVSEGGTQYPYYQARETPSTAVPTNTIIEHHTIHTRFVDHPSNETLLYDPVSHLVYHTYYELTADGWLEINQLRTPRPEEIDTLPLLPSFEKEYDSKDGNGRFPDEEYDGDYYDYGYDYGDEVYYVYELEELCGGEVYDMSLYICCEGETRYRIGVEPRCCGDQAFDAFMYECCDGVIQRSCESEYTPEKTSWGTFI